MSRFTFSPYDSWFFKESRPMESIGSNEMASLFPPTPYTMSGAIRSIIGEHAQLDWSAYRAGNGTHHQLGDVNFCTLIGNPMQSGDLGSLALNGTFIAKENETLFPVPLNLVKDAGNNKIHQLMLSSDLYQTDIGNTKLPQLPNNVVSARSLENYWMNKKGLQNYLSAGRLPHNDDLYALSDLMTTEPRLGIAIDQISKTVKKSQLYQTNHLRLQADTSIHQYFSGIDSNYLPNKPTNTRFGAEGRIASIKIESESLTLPKPSTEGIHKNTIGLTIHFLTHANFEGHWLPKNFKETINAQGQTIWQGSIKNIDIEIEGCVIGKAVREGGWDIAKHQPKPSPQMIPAGSLWYIKTSVPLPQAIEAINQTQLGQETELGRGLIVCGFWNE